MTRLTLNIETGCGCGSLHGAHACTCECEVRCDCGSLLARMVEGAVELKCRRCKRTWRIPIAGGG